MTIYDELVGEQTNWHPVCFHLISPKSGNHGRITMVATCLTNGSYLADRPGFSRLDAEPVEMTVFLTQDQAAALETMAQAQGLTVGQVIRRLVRDFTGPQRAGVVVDADPPDRGIG
jgi:hypothetical protein